MADNAQQLMDRLAARVRIDERRVANAFSEVANPDAGGVYVLRRHSRAQFHLLRALCRRLALPVPDRILNPKRAAPLPPGSWGVLFLRDRTGNEATLGLTQRYRKALLKQLRLYAGAGTEPVFMPVSFSSGLGPAPWPAPLRAPLDFSFLPLGELWQLFVFFAHRSNITAEFGPALSIGRLTAAETVHRLSLELYRKEKMARGASDDQRHTIEGIVLSGPRFEQELLELASLTSASREQLYAQARANLHEIAATMKGSAIRVLYFILKPVVRSMFQSIEVRNLDRLRNALAAHPTVLLPSHRSHFDYLLVGWILYHAGLPLPYVAAGVNLNFWPVGPVIKAAGGFFIRRSIGGDRLYKLVLDSYLRYLIKRGHLLAFYIEGGRSRTGGMRPPKLGLMKYLVRALWGGDREDLMLVPVAISYERVAEERAMIAELAGAEKTAENFWQLLKFRRFTRRSFGTVTFTFGEAFSLKGFDPVSASPGTKDEALSMFTEDLAYAASRRIMDCTAVTATSLAAASCSTFPDYSIGMERLVDRMEVLMRVLIRMRGDSHSPSNGESTGLEEIERSGANIELSATLRKYLARHTLAESMAETLQSVQLQGLLEQRSVEGTRVMEVPPSARLSLSYYTHHILHYLAPPALITQALLNDAPFIETLHALHQLFKPALLLPYWRLWRQEMSEKVKALARAGWIHVCHEGELHHDHRLELSAEGKRYLLPLPWLFRVYLEVLYATAGELLEQRGFRAEEQQFAAAVGARLRSMREFRQPARDESAATALFSFGLAALSGLGFLSREAGWDIPRRPTERGRFIYPEITKFRELHQLTGFLRTQLILLDRSLDEGQAGL